MDGTPPTSGLRKRHPESDPKGECSKSLAFCCQFCFKVGGRGVTLFRCKGCDVTLYCSKDCQKQDWPSHKEKCRFNQRSSQASCEKEDKELLTAFSAKHSYTLLKSAVSALSLSEDWRRCNDYALVVKVKKRAERARPEKALYAVAAEVFAIENLPRKDDLLFAQRSNKELEIRTDSIGSLLVILSAPELHVGVIRPLGFTTDFIAQWGGPGTPWKSELLKALNEGIVA
ncbi:unnamed protein product [Somion occarium]|uniref:MYND-type domain-containing protein n=1 Tax=Somion occarium TaxID=3059160 RepID=A0ABP1DPS3_9APHY